jgi:AraC-like DNA-binding protein
MATYEKKGFTLIKTPTVLKWETVLLSCKSTVCIAASAEKNSIIVAVKAGDIEISTKNWAGNVFTASPGSLLALSPHKEYNFKANDDSGFELQCLHLGGVHYQHHSEGIFPFATENPIIDLISDDSLALSMFEAIVQDFKFRRKDWRQVSDRLCECMFTDIHRNINVEQDAGTEESNVAQVCEFIKENYSRNISLGELSALVYISPYHLSHIFKMRMGLSPIQYLIGIRIEKAKTMLKNTNMPIAEISEAIGYPNTNYFNEIFKKGTGLTPGRFRNEVSKLKPLHVNFFNTERGVGYAGGHANKGLYVRKGKTYFLNQHGQAATGWQNTEKGRMYFTADGSAATGLTNIGNALYYFDEGHQFVTGLHAIGADGSIGKGGDLYFFKHSGEARIGWHKLDDGNWMYFGSDGKAVTGWVSWRNNWYYLGSDHIMRRGLVEVDGNQYYLNPYVGISDGAMLEGMIVVGEQGSPSQFLIERTQD